MLQPNGCAVYYAARVRYAWQFVPAVSCLNLDLLFQLILILFLIVSAVITKIFRSDSERAYGHEQFVAQWNWYVYDANYGTAAEKAFVRMLQRQMDRLKERHDGICLVRNERHFRIYNYDDGQAFEPDAARVD